LPLSRAGLRSGVNGGGSIASWRILLIGGIVATGLYFVLPPFQAPIFSTVAVVSVAAIVLGVRLNRPPRRYAWYLIAGGQAANLVGDLLWYGHEYRYGVGPPFPSALDAVYLLTYPLTTLGVIVLIRSGRGESDDGSLIDGLIVATSIGLPAWAFLISPYAYDQSLTLGEQLVSMAYPIMDVLLVAVAARVLLSRGRRSISFWFVSGALLMWLTADVAYAKLALDGTYQDGQIVDAGWLLGYVFWAAAALHPSMSTLYQSGSVRGTRITTRHLSVLAAAALIGPAVLGLQELRGERVDVAALVAGALVLFSLVLMRMAGLVRQVEANADALNRQGRTLAETVATLRATEGERSKLMDRVLRAAEDERIRIAAELHDRPIQRLTSLSYDLELARLRLEQGEIQDATEVLESFQESLSDDIQGLRRLMSSLRPPALDERGLQAALEDQVEAFGQRAKIDCSVEADLTRRLDPELETVLYRVTQEALTNVAKHAHASHAWVELKEEEGAVVLFLRDDGVGFVPGAMSDLVEQGHFGLMAIRERIEMAGGHCELYSRPGAGTTIKAVFQARELAA
jgi:signal transduction histidine kinase